MSNTLRILPALLLSFLAIYFSLASCATISSPGGGPRDTIAPKLDTSFPPNFSTRFTANEITLVFDEYVTLKSPSQQISISPPLKNKPKISSASREVTISWKDTLLENTTYIISFGNSITDFTEGNVNDKFKYVFSTGDFIDSLEISGSVVDKKGEGAKEIMVALYDYNTLEFADSIPYKNLPTYYTYTDEAGNFKLTNLKYSKFHVVAFQDIRQNFQLNSGSEQIGFLDDTLTTQLENEKLNISLFIPEGPKRFYGARHSAFGKIEMAYSHPLDSFGVKLLDSTITASLFTQLNRTKDTANIWFNPKDFQDSIILLSYDKNGPLDTSTVILKSYDAKNFAPTLAATNLKKGEPILLNFPGPIISIDTSAIRITAGNDTIAITATDSLSSFKGIALYPEKYPKDMTLDIPTASLEIMGGRLNDSIKLAVKVLGRDELGNLDFIVKSDSVGYPLILKVYTEAGKLIHESSFYQQTKVQFKNYFAGKYKAEIILDKNADGKWSTGDYLKRLQPEKVLYYNEPIEVRANWDLELEWQLDLEEE